MKHSGPSIDETVARAADEGVDELLCIALAPHYSITGTGSYMERVDGANEKLGRPIGVKIVESWHTSSNLVESWRRSISAVDAWNPFLIFSAHSLPAETEDRGPYKSQLLDTAMLVASAAGVRHWGLAFQSQGRHTGWYGPTISELVEQERRRDEQVVVAPIGFVADNLEILYDLDIELKERMEGADISFRRAAMPNASGPLVDALREAVSVVAR